MRNCLSTVPHFYFTKDEERMVYLNYPFYLPTNIYMKTKN